MYFIGGKALKLRKRNLFLMLFLMLASLLSLGGIKANAITASRIYYSTDNSFIGIGQTFNIYVNSENVNDLYGASVDFKYDPSLLQILDITEGDVFKNSSKPYSTVIKSSLPDTTGVVSMGLALQGNISSFNGNGKLFVIKAKALKAGTVNLKTTDNLSLLGTSGLNMCVKLANSSATKITGVTYQALSSVTLGTPIVFNSLTTDKSSPQLAGVGIKVTAEAAGGTSLLYRFWIYDGTAWTVVQNYSSANYYNFVPSKAATYRIWVDVKDKTSTKDVDLSKELSYVVSKSAVINSITTDKQSQQNTGTAIKVTANASYGTSLLYRFWLYDGSTWTVAQDYSSSNYYNWTPSKAATYRIWVDVKDTTSVKDVDVSKEISYVISGPIEFTSITVNKTSPQLTGAGIKVTANASGGTSLLYRFWIYDGGTWTVVQNYSTANNYNWIPSKAATYKIWVDVKDKLSTKNVDLSKEISYTICKPAVFNSITTDKQAPQKPTTPIKITANASGGTSSLYRFWIYDGAAWTVVQDYSSTNYYDWTPSKASVYKIWIDVKDATSPKDVDTSKQISYILCDSVSLASITANKTSPQLPGAGIKVTANASGGTSLLYRFWIYDGAAWTVVQDYSSANYYSWTPSKAAAYRIWVDVKDKISTKSVDLSKEISYTICRPAAFSSITTDKQGPQKPGTPIKITANTSGGTSSLYRFWIYDGSAWTVVQDYSSSNYYNWTPSKAAVYKIWVDVKDVTSVKAVDTSKQIFYTVQ